MIFGKETEILEFKETTGEIKEAVISIASILNKHGKGELYFGIKDDGFVLGQQIGKITLRDVSKAVSDHLKPQIFPKIDAVTIDDKRCIRVAFEGSDSPYFAFDRAYIRVADENKKMSPAEIESYILKRNIGRDAWDSALSDKTIADVDEDVLQDYLERANRAKRIDFTYSSKEEVLHKLDLIAGGKLNNAASVLFCKMRELEVQMAIFAGTERLTFNDIKREHGDIITLVEVAENYIRNNIRWRVVLDGSIQRKEIPEIPIDAVREALINSYCHRLFISSQNNEISIYKNRVEIYNPGTFPEGLKPEDFIDGHERSIKRNPLLARLMYYSKDIESFGTGLKRIKEACDEAHVRVEFQLLKLGFAVVFYRPDEHFDAAADTRSASDPVNDPVNGPVNDPVNQENDLLNKVAKTLLSVLSDNGKLTYNQLADVIGISESSVKRSINMLKEHGLIERVGSDKKGYWKVT